MWIIENDIIPFPGYKCINLCGILFVRTGAKMDEIDFNHEAIHSRQILELGVIGFYLWYLIEWLWKFIYYGDPHVAYRDISFEKESYFNEGDLEYLKTRKFWAFWEYA